MMPIYRTDLHIHSCLSPCAEMEMAPHRIIGEAVARGIDIVAICDHNAAANLAAALAAAESGPVTVIPGMEVTTREEVHVVALFDALDGALDMEALVHAHLEGENTPEYFGPQIVVDPRGEPVGSCSRLLIGATRLHLREVVDAIHARGGCALAAHVDRDRFSLISQLGFVPPDLPLDGLEHSPNLDRAGARARYGENGRWELVCSSDAHRLADIGAGTSVLELERPTGSEIRRALRRIEGRAVVG